MRSAKLPIFPEGEDENTMTNQSGYRKMQKSQIRGKQYFN